MMFCLYYKGQWWSSVFIKFIAVMAHLFAVLFLGLVFACMHLRIVKLSLCVNVFLKFYQCRGRVDDDLSNDVES